MSWRHGQELFEPVPGREHRVQAMEEIEYAGYSQAVVDLLAPFFVLHDARVLQEREVLGDRG